MTHSKNLLLSLMLLTGIIAPVHALKSLKKAALSQEEQFLANLRKTVEEKKAEEIARLQNSKNPKKQAKAEELKKKTRIDHIKVVIKGGKTTYLQLENSRSGFFGGRSHPYDSEKLNKKLHELCQKHGLSLKDVTEIAVYQSTKVRKNFILGSLWGNKDLYSAAFYIGTTKKDNPSRLDLLRNMRRQPSRNNQPRS